MEATEADINIEDDGSWFGLRQKYETLVAKLTERTEQGRVRWYYDSPEVVKMDEIGISGVVVRIHISERRLTLYYEDEQMDCARWIGGLESLIDAIVSQIDRRDHAMVQMIAALDALK